MKLIHTDLKKGLVKIKVENLDDLWYLNQIIEKNDFIKGKTLRKIKIGKETQRKQKKLTRSRHLSGFSAHFQTPWILLDNRIATACD